MDIVERLQYDKKTRYTSKEMIERQNDRFMAADEIERLRDALKLEKASHEFTLGKLSLEIELGFEDRAERDKEIERLREYLTAIVFGDGSTDEIRVKLAAAKHLRGE